MKKEKSETPAMPADGVRGDVKPIRYEAPEQRPKPTPNPPKKKNT